METDESWTCARCTLRNEGGAVCEACGWRPGAPSASDDDSGSDASGASDDEYAMAVEAPEEAAHTVEVHVARRLWEETEARRIAQRDDAAGPGPTAAVSFDEKKAARAQIFSSQACFRLLSEELFKIKSARSPRLAGEAEGNDVYTWSVRLGVWPPDASGLGADLAALGARHPGCGADTVELRLSFKADLYPFYPPAVDVVRPRLAGAARAALVAHPCLRLVSWDPFSTAVQTVERLRAFLEMHARVDFAAGDANDPRACANAVEAPLSRLDGLLAQLGALQGLVPASFAPLYDAAEAAWAQRIANLGDAPRPLPPMRDAAGLKAAAAAQHKAAGGGAGPAPSAAAASAAASAAAAAVATLADADADADMGSGPEEEEEEEEAGDAASRKRKAGAYWAKGTGYGHDGATGNGEERWDPAKAAAAQAAQDEATLRLTAALSATVAQLRAGPPGDLAAAEALLGRSVLPEYLERELRQLSFQDMASRTPFYAALLRLAQAVGATRAAPSFAAAAAALAAVEAQAKMFLRLSQPAQQRAQDAPPAAAAAAQPAAPTAEAEVTATSSGAAPAGGAASAAAGEDAIDDFGLSNLVIAAAESLRPAPAPAAAVPSRGAAPASRASSGAAASGRKTRAGAAAASAAAAAQATAAPAAAAAGAPPLASATAADGCDPAHSAYCARVGPLQLDSCQLGDTHHYRAEVRGEGVSSAQLRRVAKESAGLAALLPLSPSSTVCVRVDEAAASLWRALITGPEGTPYSGGCFVFDIFFPSTYPAVPPKVNLQTTGGGSVRFNPNLYNCGKVCLSLLGTWQGGKGEGWDPAASSALQVLVSIQSLIFVAQPVFNEPGHERQMGTPQGEAMNRSYNNVIRDATVRYAMLEQLRKPRPEFAEVVRAHFSLRRAAILAECGDWARSGSLSARLMDELTTELNRLA